MARISTTGYLSFLRKRREESERLAGFEKELVQAEGRQASPFGNPNLTRKQAASGEGFSPVKGSVSEGAQSLFDEGPDSAKRKKAKKELDKQVARDTRRLGKTRGSTVFSQPKAPSSLLGGAATSVQGSKMKLGV